jgi:3-hydroxyacyl-[acyl-carrier-protein] dehydratase
MNKNVDVVKEYSFREIKSILPHDYPFIFIDRATLLEIGKKIRCIKNITGGEYYFAGHFKDNPIMPGVILIEAMAQSVYLLGKVSAIEGAKLSLETHKKKPAEVRRMLEKVQSKQYYLAGIKRLRFFKPIYPGDQIIIDAEITTRLRASQLAEIKASVGSDVVCRGEFIFVIG